MDQPYPSLPWRRAEVTLRIRVVVDPDYPHAIGPEWVDGNPTITVRPDVTPEALGAVILGAMRQTIRLEEE